MAAEVGLAAVAGVVSFVFLAAVLSLADSDAVAVLLAVAAGAAVLEIAHRWGAAYAIPAAVLGLVAYDWFVFPPTHPEEFPDRDNLLSLLAYLAVGTVAGELAAYGARRAESSEAARALLADEQAALRRVATVIARGATREAVFDAIAREVATLVRVDEILMLRYEDDQHATVLASARPHSQFPVGSHQTLGGENLATRVRETGGAVRIDDFGRAGGAIGLRAREIGMRSAVGTPIVVDARLWGVLVTGTHGDAPLPADTESRVSEFTDLMATAIANAESELRAELLSNEQAALRRVATLVAKDAPPAEIFAKVAEEAAALLGADCTVWRDDGEGNASVVAVHGTVAPAAFPVGTRIALEGDGVTEYVLREGRPRRVEDYAADAAEAAEGASEFGVSSAVGHPVLVRGDTWGAIIVATFGDAEPCPPGTESRLAQFADLGATAIAHAEARGEVERLAEEQAALRRVATLVAEGIEPAELFAAVTKEVCELFSVDEPSLVPSIIRFDPGPEFVLVGAAEPMYALPVGSRWGPRELYVSTRVQRTGRSARVEQAEVDATPGPDADLLRRQGFLNQVGSPILVEGRVWGALTMNSAAELPPDTGERLEKFTELLETAIANADSRDQLAASRARLLTAADEARRRVVRDLHDGAQQRLVHSIITLKLAHRALHENGGEAATLVEEALEQAQQGNAELRELAHGILPAVLTRGGLRAGVDTVVARLDLPVAVDIADGRFDPEIEASAYFIVAEALTNVVKHAQAGRAEVKARVEDGTLRVEVRDDGKGGADPAGHGLVGLGDRATALGGRLRVESPPGGGTVVMAALPLPGNGADRG